MDCTQRTWPRCVAVLIAVLAMTATASVAQAQFRGPKGKFVDAVAFDSSKALREAGKGRPPWAGADDDATLDIRPDRGAVPTDTGFLGDGAMSRGTPLTSAGGATIAPPLLAFDGPSSADNFSVFGFRVNPPDPVGDIGPNHYVAMSNLTVSVYDRSGNRLVGPTDIGDFWAGFSVPDCTDPSGDPIVLYDQLEDRWVLTQFTTRGYPNNYYLCIAVSKTGDPTGEYYRYAFSTDYFFPDYPKFGVWTDSYLATTREFGDFGGYGIGVYALEKRRMIAGDPKARAVQYRLLDTDVPLSTIGDGLLPADVDGTRRPQANVPAPIVGSQDAGAFYGASSDALNVWELSVQWNSKPTSSLKPPVQLAVAEFDSIFPCPGGGRRCLPQPGAATSQYLDILSYRQRVLHRLAYRNFGTHEALVATQSVEAAPGVAGVRWYEIRRTNGQYSLYQQGTYAPGDGVHRWMSSAAMDWQGNIAIGFSVTNSSTVYPGIRYTGRLAADPLGTLPLGEATLVNGTGIQRSINNRWGDYTSLNVDPLDDCTFWYINEYYSAASSASSVAGWLTRIGAFKLPGCVVKPE